MNLYVQGTGAIALETGQKVKLTQQTRYPWDGAVRITVAPDVPGSFGINVRIPGWARDEPVPGDLYRFMDRAPATPVLKVNGAAVPLTLDKGYVRIARAWKSGDVIDLTLPMPVRRVIAHEKVEDDTGRVALQRGPIVYAAEWPDNPHGRVRNIVLPDSSRMASEYRPALLNGVEVITGRVSALSYDAKGAALKVDQPFVAIPYATWANRGPGEMIVWLPRTDASARPAPFPTVATAATVTVSTPGQGRGKSPRPINDGEEPRSSDDPGAYFDWWPTLGSPLEWVEMTFAKPTAVIRILRLLVRRYRPRGCPRPGLVANSLQGRRRVETREDRRTFRCRARHIQSRHVRHGHDESAPHRGRHATEVLRGAPGVEVKGRPAK